MEEFRRAAFGVECTGYIAFIDEAVTLRERRGEVLVRGRMTVGARPRSLRVTADLSRASIGAWPGHATLDPLLRSCEA
jgi:hypothetical protein